MTNLREMSSLIGFQALKALIVLVAIVCGILEATEYYAWSSYIDEINNSGLYPDFNTPKSKYFKKYSNIDGHVRIWYYIVIILTILGTTVYLSQVRWIWKNKTIILTIEIFYFTLWFSASLANLDPLYSGSGFNCSSIRTDTGNDSINKIAQWTKLQCSLALSSLIVGWFNVLLCLISSIIAWKTAGVDLDNDSPDSFSPNIFDDSRITRIRSSGPFF
ncbi:hypothetical protein Glove_140g114 [Diversispora epigaea]|uniref:MARVEL domain-containing protein n=1 Tax=Diversispora epigaea TaxID=1348612 RepID=A0A397J4M0_9GLOM|nr:hypothetical protein Glove_140g114 [Diversispora epigaea]